MSQVYGLTSACSGCSVRRRTEAPATRSERCCRRIEEKRRSRRRGSTLQRAAHAKRRCRRENEHDRCDAWKEEVLLGLRLDVGPELQQVRASGVSDPGSALKSTISPRCRARPSASCTSRYFSSVGSSSRDDRTNVRRKHQARTRIALSSGRTTPARGDQDREEQQEVAVRQRLQQPGARQTAPASARADHPGTRAWRTARAASTARSAPAGGRAGRRGTARTPKATPATTPAVAEPVSRRPSRKAKKPESQDDRISATL